MAGELRSTKGWVFKVVYKYGKQENGSADSVNLRKLACSCTERVSELVNSARSFH